ncbi:hypothetical protein AAG906_007996 [Vitis piasezkii]
MIMRSLQPRFARHLMGFPHVDFGSLVQALYGIEEGIARGLWPNSSPSDSKRKKPAIGQRSRDVSAISAARPRPPRYYQTVGQTSGVYYPPSPHDLHYAYHQSPGHDTNHCSALRHAIQDLIDQGLDDGFLEMIVPNDDYEIVMTRSGRIAQVAPPITRPFGGTNSREEVRRENDEILRQL